MIRAQYALLGEFHRAPDVIGTFDRITTARLPTQHRSVVFSVLLVTDEAADVGPYDVKVRCLKPDGVPLFEHALRVELRATDDGTWLASARVVFELQGLPLPVAGKYRFVLEGADGTELASHPFTVALRATPPAS